MTLRGDLREFGLLDLLSLAYGTRKSGTLVVRSASTTVESLFQEGQFADVRLGGATSVFADVALHAAEISPEQHRGAILEHCATDPAYGAALLQVSGLSRVELPCDPGGDRSVQRPGTGRSSVP